MPLWLAAGIESPLLFVDKQSKPVAQRRQQEDQRQPNCRVTLLTASEAMEFSIWW